MRLLGHSWLAASVLASLLGGCSCEDTTSADAARADARPSDLRRPEAGDTTPPDTGSDRGMQWKRDIGPDPDINLAACADARPPDGVADSAASIVATPAIKWKALLGTGNLGSSAPVQGPDGTLYVTSRAGLHAVSAGGTAKWAIPSPDMWLDPYPVTLVGSMLIFGSWEGFHGVRPSDGQPLWSQRVLLPPLDPTAHQSATAVGATLAGEFVIAGANHKLFIADTTGNIRVTTPNSAAIIHGWFPVVGSDGSSYFSVIASPARVASFSVDGVRRWMRSYGPGEGSGILALGAKGELLIGMGTHKIAKPYGSALVGVDSSCGSERWRTSFAGIVQYPMVVGLDGTIYLATHEPQQLLAVRPGGKVAWTISEQTGLWSTTIGPIGADGTIYTIFSDAWSPGGEPSQVRAYSLAGQELWKLPVPGLFTDGTAVLRNDGMLIFSGMIREGTTDNTYLIAVQTRSPGLAKSPWPRGRHDNQNTGNQGTPLP